MGAMLGGELDNLTRRRPGQEPDTPGPVGALDDDRQLTLEPVAGTTPATDEPEASAVGDRSGGAPAEPAIAASARGDSIALRSVNFVRSTIPHAGTPGASMGSTGDEAQALASSTDGGAAGG